MKKRMKSMIKWVVALFMSLLSFIELIDWIDNCTDDDE